MIKKYARLKIALCIITRKGRKPMLAKSILNKYRRYYRKQIFGLRLKNWREASGYTQQEFAPLLDYPSSQYVANIENGTVPLPAEKIPLICKIVNNITPDNIIECLLEVERLILKSRVYGRKFPQEDSICQSK